MRGERGRSLTYAELDALSDAFADDILTATGGETGPVALVLPRGADMLTALFGVLKAGCWYVPFSLDEPADRLVPMLRTARPLLVVGGAEHTHAAFQDSGIPGSPSAGTSAGPRVRHGICRRRPRTSPRI